MALILGGGLIAKKFIGAALPSDCVVIASGVSNSQETSRTEFEREIQLVSGVIESYPDTKCIYFSSCSVYQENKTPYIHHKLFVEDLIKQFPKYHIFRLPQVVGCVNNSTLVSFLTRSVLAGQPIQVQKHAARNILDVDDVVRLVKFLVFNEFGVNSVQNIASSRNVGILDILTRISQILDTSPQFQIVDAGENYSIPIEFMRAKFEASDCIFSSDYWEKVLLKYVPLLARVENN